MEIRNITFSIMISAGEALDIQGFLIQTAVENLVA